MRIVLLLPSNHIYANFITKEIIKELNKSIVMVIESNTLIPKKSFWNGTKEYIVISGFEYFFTQAIKQILFIIGRFIAGHIFMLKNDKNLFYSYKKIARRYGIPVMEIDDINSLPSIKTIEKGRPDLIISIYFRQILQKEILELPKKGCLNIHPSLLPHYQGVSPLFWALAKDEKDTGVTIHFIDKDIDKGDIIAQRSIPIERGDSEHILFLKCSAIAISMLLEKMKQIEDGSLVRIRQEKEGSYFSLPTKSALKIFKNRGCKFFKIKDFFNGEKNSSDFI